MVIRRRIEIAGGGVPAIEGSTGVAGKMATCHLVVWRACLVGEFSIGRGSAYHHEHEEDASQVN